MMVLKSTKNRKNNYKIETSIKCNGKIIYSLVPIAVKHVFINLISNAKDAKFIIALPKELV